MSLSCANITAYQMGCRNSNAGIKKVWIGEFNDAATFTYDATTKEILTFSPTGATTVVPSFELIEQPRLTVSFDQAGEVKNTNLGPSFVPTCVLKFGKMDPETRNKLMAMAQTDVWVMGLDNNGRYVLLGRDGGMTATKIDLTTGKTLGDEAGATVTFTGNEAEIASYVTTAAATAVIVA